MPVRVLLGHAAQDSGDCQKDRQYLHKTLTWARAHEDARLLPWVLVLAARLFTDAEEIEKTTLYHAAAVRHRVARDGER